MICMPSSMERISRIDQKEHKHIETVKNEVCGEH